MMSSLKKLDAFAKFIDLPLLNEGGVGVTKGNEKKLEAGLIKGISVF